MLLFRSKHWGPRSAFRH